MPWKDKSLTEVGFCPAWDKKWLPNDFEEAKAMNAAHEQRVHDFQEICICDTGRLAMLADKIRKEVGLKEDDTIFRKKNGNLQMRIKTGWKTVKANALDATTDPIFAQQRLAAEQ